MGGKITSVTSKYMKTLIEYPDHDHDENCDCEAEIKHSQKVDDLIDNLSEDVPHFSIRDGLLVQDNWTEEDISDFFSDFLDIDLESPDDSTHRVAKDCYEELMKENAGRVNAELMSAGIEWYLDRKIKEIRG